MSVAADILATVDPVLLRHGLQLARRPTGEALAMLRAASFAPQSSSSSSVTVEDRSVESAEGQIPVRIYRPSGSVANGVLINIHGGGWVAGSIAGDDAHCRLLTSEAGVVTVSVGYRLAPEHRFPAAIDDCIAVIRWAGTHAPSLGATRKLVAIRGASAGANVAAAAALKMREASEGGGLALQILLYPICDADLDSASAKSNATGYFLTTEDLRWYWEQYVGDADPHHPHASLLRAPDLSDLPPTLVITAEYDPLRDEGEAFAERLTKAGVATTLLRYEGAIHGFVTLAPSSESSRRALHDSADALRRVFAGSRSG